MNYYYITGTSRGIGKALALLLLQENNNYVIGLSRTNTIEHERYEHIDFDLSNFEQVANYGFIDILDAEKVILINNAGMIGDVKHAGNIDNKYIFGGRLGSYKYLNMDETIERALITFKNFK